MSKVNINFNDYKSSGVYFVEIDNSIIDNIVATSGRLAVGFSKKGPFNAPVYIEDTATLAEVFGGVDKKLERKGVYFNRALQTLLRATPIYALNLLPIEPNSKTGGLALGLKSTSANAVEEPKSVYDASAGVRFVNLYDKSRFWKASEDYLRQFVKFSDAPEAIKFANAGTEDFTLIIRKAEGLKGYNVTVGDWYGRGRKPYVWMQDADSMSDYFIQVICIKGKWDNQALVADSYWKTFFESVDGRIELKKSQLNKFLRLDAVEIIGDWTGCILPEFYDKTGVLQSIDAIINQSTTSTGLLISIDSDVYDEAAADEIDFIGRGIDDNEHCNFMSYDFDYGKVKYGVDASYVQLDETAIEFKRGFDEVDASTGEYLHKNAVELYKALAVGATVVIGDRTVKVTKKKVLPIDPSVLDGAAIRFELSDIVDVLSVSEIKIIPQITEKYQTLRPIYVKGLDIDEVLYGADGKGGLFAETSWTDGEGNSYIGEDAPIAKIYAMLEDEGIHRGLTNPDTIDFRYLVDTMGHGLGVECGSKRFLARLAKAVQHCTAFINAPSVTEFANCRYAAFYDLDDPYQKFDTKYVVSGGNEDAIRNVEFTLPTEEDGSKHAGIFSPYLKYRSGSKTILVPPAADVANAYMTKYNGGDPYVTIANMNGILSNPLISGIEYEYDRKDQDNLEPFGINPILIKNGNVMIYGDRTAYQDVISDFNYLHVREILNTIEIECKAVLDKYVFTYNNAATRAEILLKLNPILKGMQDAGALYKFEIQMDENNNTEEVIDRSFAIVDIGVWITKNMEKIVTRIKVNKLSE